MLFTDLVPFVGPTKKSFTQSRSNVSRTHQNTPTRAAPGPPGRIIISWCRPSPLYIIKQLATVSCFHLMTTIFLFVTVAHQNGGPKNTNHMANQRNASQHSNQRPPSTGNGSRPFLPNNVILKERGSNHPKPNQPNLDCLKVPDQGAAG